ncbi:MAG: Asp-tRNA(Asn)/Glu-tRNA(Gln) amidotransferase GatCAB subunit B, partial [Planctomycetota bacterium]
RPRGQVEFGTRAEVKNLNSFTNVEAALVYEIERQEGVLRSGGTVKQETRLFDAERGETRSMRGKEDAHDYRYFPEPDLPTITISRDWVEQERAQLPELPVAMRQRLRETLGLSAYDAGILTSQRSHAEYFEQLVATGLDPKDASNWFQSDILRELNERRIQLHEIPLQPEQIAVIVRAVATDRVSVATGREVLKEALAGEADPAALLAARGEQVSDTTELLAWVDAVIEANADTVAKIRAGNDKAIAFLMGQVMKESGGKANPRVVSKMIHERLQE